MQLGLHQRILHLPACQAIQTERFVIGQHFLVIVPVNAQTLLEKILHRGLQKGRQIRQCQFIREFGRRQQRPPRCFHTRRSGTRFAPQPGSRTRRIGLLQRLLPFAGIAEQPIFPGKIRPAERLQPVLRGQRGQQCLAALALRRRGVTLLARQPPPRGNMVTQLRHQHRGRTMRVVMNAAPHPAEGEPLACRQQRLQKKVAVILPPGTVAGAIVARHQVEIGRLARARKIPVIHAQQTYVPERNGPHRHQRGKGHGAGKKAPSQPVLVDAGQPVLPYHRQRQRQVHPRLGTVIKPLLQRLVQAHQQQPFPPVIRPKEGVQQRLQTQAPFGRRRLAAAGLPGLLQGVEQRLQASKQLAI